jgi:hypothetical protein
MATYTGTMPTLNPEPFDPTRPPRRRLADPGTAYGVSTSTVDPANDLRSQQILPGTDPRLARSSGQTDTARTNLANTAFADYTPVSNAGSPYTAEADQYRGSAASSLGTGVVGNTDTSRAQGYLTQAAQSYGAAPTSVGGVNYGADTAAARARLSGSLGALEGPDRGKLAADAFKLLQEQNAPGRALSFQNVGRKAAALGRVGAGMTTNDLTGLEGTYAREDDQAQRGLAGDAAAQTLADRLGITNALSGVTGQLAGIDQNTAGINMDAATRSAGLSGQRGDAFRALSGDQLGLDRLARSEGIEDRNYGLDRSSAFSRLSGEAFGQGRDLRNESRDEGDRRLAYDKAGLDKNAGIYDALAGGEQQVFNQGRDVRDEIRGERGYQTDRAQEGIDNALRQRMAEEDLLNSGAQRGTDLTKLYEQLGYGGSDALGGVLGDQAATNEQASSDAFGGIGDLLSQYLQGKGQEDANVDYATSGYTPKVVNTTQTVRKPLQLARAPSYAPRYG